MAAEPAAPASGGGDAPPDLWHDPAYRRLWMSIVIASLGAQVTLLALPLTAALLLHATPLQMGLLTAMEILPFVLLSLPAGVWLDRVRKLPVYVAGELSVAAAVASIPAAWALGWLSMAWLYAVGFAIGMVNTVAGSASQIVLTQVVPRERLVEAHARNALASSGAEVAGPGLAGALIKLAGAPLALLIDAAMLLLSAVVLTGMRVQEPPGPPRSATFRRDLAEGLGFVRRHGLLVALAWAVGGWQFCHNAVQGVQILWAARGLGLSEQVIGLAYATMGAGTVAASAFGSRLSARWGPGPTMLLGMAACAIGWLLPALAGSGRWGLAAFVAMLLLNGVGAVLVFINFLGLRQAATPTPLLGRMTSTMRWLILLPAGPGALLGGYVGEHAGLRATLGGAGALGLLLVALCWRARTIPAVRALPAVPE